MKILLVEDDLKFATDFMEELSTRIPGVELALAGSQREGLEAIEAEVYDLIICDLKIPTDHGRLDEAVEHGLAVHDDARARVPGTPIIILSAYGTLDIVKELYERAPREDPFGVGEKSSMSQFRRKDQLPELVAQVENLAAEFATTDAVDVSFGGVDLELDPNERRALKLYARKHGGAVARISPLGGGLSSASVLRVEVKDSAGSVVSRAVARIAQLEDIEEEVKSFRDLVLPQLGTGAFVHLIDEVYAGAGRTGAVFYWFAGGNGGLGYDETLFEVLEKDEDRAVDAVDRLKNKLGPWVGAGRQEQIEVIEVRRVLISDDEVANLSPPLEPEMREPEQRQIFCQRAPEHGDLHGANVMVRGDNDPVLIDFASIVRTSLALDPVTLELSLVFHPLSPILGSGWPTAVAAEQWASLENYLVDCPVPKFVRSCREWAYDRAATDREVLAVAYSFAVRQLQYSSDKHEIAHAMMHGTALALLD